MKLVQKDLNLLILACESILWVGKMKHVRHLKMKLIQRTDGPDQIHYGMEILSMLDISKEENESSPKSL